MVRVSLFSCLHWFFIAWGPGWPTAPIRRRLLFWDANIFMGKLKIKVISCIKLHSSVLGLPWQSRRPLTRASPTPKLLWIFHLAAVFSGFADVVLGATCPSTRPPFHVRREGWGRGLGGKSVSLSLMTNPSSAQAKVRLRKRTEASSRARDRRLYSSGPEATIMTSAEGLHDNTAQRATEHLNLQTLFGTWKSFAFAQLLSKVGSVNH